MALFKTSTPEEDQFWAEYSDYSYKFMRKDLALLLGVEPKRISVPLLREKFYTVGIQPNEFVVRTLAPPSMPRTWHGDSQFEIRFAGPLVVSVLRLAGLLR